MKNLVQPPIEIKYLIQLIVLKNVIQPIDLENLL